MQVGQRYNPSVTVIPNFVLKIPSRILSLPEKVILSKLGEIPSENRRAATSINRIAEETGETINSIKIILESLENKQFIEEDDNKYYFIRNEHMAPKGALI